MDHINNDSTNSIQWEKLISGSELNSRKALTIRMSLLIW